MVVNYNHFFISFPILDLQDPAEADKLLKIQRELDETKIILVSIELWAPWFYFIISLLL